MKRILLLALLLSLACQYPRDPLAARVESSVRKLEWVEDAAVRLREEGHVYCGEVFVVPRHGANLLSATEKVHELATGLDWRLHMISR